MVGKRVIGKRGASHHDHHDHHDHDHDHHCYCCCLLPRLPSRDKPSFALSSHQERSRRVPDILYFSDSPRICTSRYKKLYIKSYHYQDLGIKEMMNSPKEFGYGVSQCLTREYAVCNQTYTKMLGIFPGVNTKPTCLINNQPAFSAGTPWPSCLNTHLSAIIPSFQTLANLNTLSRLTFTS